MRKTIMLASFILFVICIGFYSYGEEESIPWYLEAPTSTQTPQEPMPEITESLQRDLSPWLFGDAEMEDTIQYSEQMRQSVENSEEWLIGHWTMTERRKNEYNDLIHFGIDILSIDEYGNMDLIWGGTQITGKWDDRTTTIKVYDDQVYILDHGMLGGGNENYSGLAIKDGTDVSYRVNSIIGHWVMTERRKNEYNDVIQFGIDILSIDKKGNVDVVWGNNQIQGKWDAEKLTLTVYDNQVYVYDYGVLAGGNINYSGLATR